jgi:undecaprenyl-diphosphatase
MDLIQAMILGIVQGLTEFIPVSSTGHLLLVRQLLGLHQEAQSAFAFDILIQMGTWVAVMVFYWHDLILIARDMLNGWRGQTTPQAKIGWLIIAATIPAVLLGWLAKDSMTGLVSGLGATGLFLLVNAAFLFIAELVGNRQRKMEELNSKDALIIGAFQASALLPAVSRSAASLSGGMLRNLSRRQAARFAFLMAVPIMPAAAVIGILDLGTLSQGGDLIVPLVIGFLTSALIGYLSIRWLLNYLANKSLYPFIYYCIVVGTIAIVLN